MHMCPTLTTAINLFIFIFGIIKHFMNTIMFALLLPVQNPNVDENNKGAHCKVIKIKLKYICMNIRYH